VDDGSEDDSLAMLEAKFPTVRVTSLQESVGFGAACNLGFETARNDLVLLLNSDMEVTPGSVGLLLGHFSDPQVFAAGPRYVSSGEDTEPQDDGPALVRPQFGSPAGGGIFRRAAFLELSGFDPLYYPFYWEDIDLGWNAWRAGHRIIYDARCHFLHLESVTIKRLYSPGFVRRIRARNRCLFGWKNLISPPLRRLHNLMLARHIIADLIKRRDPASLLGFLDAWRMRKDALSSRPETVPARTDQQILADSETDLKMLLRI
jgi:GT2 family glycosyltransferase